MEHPKSTFNVLLRSFQRPKTTHKNVYIVHNRIFENCIGFCSCSNYHTNKQFCLCRPCPGLVNSFRVGTAKSLCTDSPNGKSAEMSISCSACHRTFEECWTNLLSPSSNHSGQVTLRSLTLQTFSPFFFSSVMAKAFLKCVSAPTNVLIQMYVEMGQCYT